MTPKALIDNETVSDIDKRALQKWHILHMSDSLKVITPPLLFLISFYKTNEIGNDAC